MKKIFIIVTSAIVAFLFESTTIKESDRKPLCNIVDGIECNIKGEE